MNKGQSQQALFELEGDGQAAPQRRAADDLVPFGKFRGQSLAVLLKEAKYALWLLNSMGAKLRTDHPALYAWLIGNFGAPENTPEHNQLTNRFLDDDFRLQLAVLLNPSLSTAPAIAISQERVMEAWRKWLPKRIAAEVSDAKEDLRFNSKAGTDPVARRGYLNGLVLAKIEKVLDGLRVTANLKSTAPKIVWAPVVETTEPKFEVDGADVEFTLAGSAHIGFDEPLRQYGDNHAHAPIFVSWGINQRYRVEAKPFVGDDYPSILRTMVATKCNLLLVESFDAEGATLEQLRKVFASQGIQVAMVDDVLTTEVPASVRELVIAKKDREAMLALAVEEVKRYLDKLDARHAEANR